MFTIILNTYFNFTKDGICLKDPVLISQAYIFVVFCLESCLAEHMKIMGICLKILIKNVNRALSSLHWYIFGFLSSFSAWWSIFLYNIQHFYTPLPPPHNVVSYNIIAVQKSSTFLVPASMQLPGPLLIWTFF